MEQQIKDIFSNVMGVASEAVNDDSSPETVPKWDSLHQLNLILALEDVFNIRFPSEDVLSLLTFRKIVSTVKELAAIHR